MLETERALEAPALCTLGPGALTVGRGSPVGKGAAVHKVTVHHAGSQNPSVERPWFVA